ncbi:TetR/AcrR family transcriptional regulator [Endozoicomonas elysicola]|uniref:TetR/AcrR family transcriptional regulator n=1 Tax=Endozoicomonas elysicola TaxID=305900 RepID=UPI00036FC0CF|nr:TetR/AcrR family transcriptional regulator [Endozoicomonas elysicola]
MNKETPNTTALSLPQFNKAKMSLILVAEKMIAEKGLNAISEREIAREAGQRNNSAVQYHFGSRAGLVSAILDLRMIPLNARRHEMLMAIKPDQAESVKALVEALVMPYIHNLIEYPAEGYYVSLVTQLAQSGQHDQLLFDGPRSSSLQLMSQMMRDALPELNQSEFRSRMGFAGTQLIHTVALWDLLRRQQPEIWTNHYLIEQSQQLIAFIVGGLKQ